MDITISLTISDLGALLDSGSLKILMGEDTIILEIPEALIPFMIKAHGPYSHHILVPISFIRAGITHIHLIGVAYQKNKGEV
jgi:hypothetical protein